MRPFDFVVTLWSENPPEVRVDFRTGEVGPVHPEVDGEKPDPARDAVPWNSGGTVATLKVRYGWTPDGDLRARSATLEADGLTPTELTRFAWARWMGAADAVARTRTERFGGIGAAIHAETSSHPAPKALGRRPLTPEHYRKMLDRYRELKAQGDPRAYKTLQAELEQEFGYEPAYRTVTSWVRRAPERLRKAEGVEHVDPALPKAARKVSKRAGGPVDWDGVTAPWEKE